MFETLLGERKEIVWAWLFPVTYLIHVSEEYFAGVALAPSPTKIRGANLTPTQFLILQGLACVLLVVGIIVSRRFNFREWLLICLGTVVLVNGLFHVVGSLRIAGYNPGLVSGVLIWIPLGAATLIHLKKRIRPDRYWAAFAVGVGINVIVLIIARGGRRLFEG
jgi:hypothetical protein